MAVELGSGDRDSSCKESVTEGCGYLFSTTLPRGNFSVIFLHFFRLILILCYSVGFSCVLLSSFKSFLRQNALFRKALLIHSLLLRVHESTGYKWVKEENEVSSERIKKKKREKNG